jgi:hypothetical protein
MAEFTNLIAELKKLNDALDVEQNRSRLSSSFPVLLDLFKGIEEKIKKLNDFSVIEVDDETLYVDDETINVDDETTEIFEDSAEVIDDSQFELEMSESNQKMMTPLYLGNIKKKYF